MITVVNKHWHKPTENDVYCGRGSPVGNPYSHLPSSVSGTIKVSSREEAIEKFRADFEYRYFNDVAFHAFLRELTHREYRGLDTNLVCYCAPHACHCDVIKSWVEEKIVRLSEKSGML